MGITEHWVYVSRNVLKCMSIVVGGLTCHECHTIHTSCSRTRSLAVGTELLVYGKEMGSHIVLRYSFLNDSWTPGIQWTHHCAFFGYASLSEKAIIASGSDSQGTVLDSAELYNSLTHRPRKMCSGVFMDGKFYVIGGMVKLNSLLPRRRVCLWILRE